MKALLWAWWVETVSLPPFRLGFLIGAALMAVPIAVAIHYRDNQQIIVDPWIDTGQQIIIGAHMRYYPGDGNLFCIEAAKGGDPDYPIIYVPCSTTTSN